MRTNAASVRPIDGQAAKALPRTQFTASQRAASVKPVSADGLCCLASAAQRALEIEQEYADVSDR